MTTTDGGMQADHLCVLVHGVSNSKVVRPKRESRSR